MRATSNTVVQPSSSSALVISSISRVAFLLIPKVIHYPLGGTLVILTVLSMPQAKTFLPIVLACGESW